MQMTKSSAALAANQSFGIRHSDFGHLSNAEIRTIGWRPMPRWDLGLGHWDFTQKH
jgi:hypothetical protein